METIHNTLPLPKDCYTQKFFQDHTAFFDIETTGFSAKTSRTYLIGIVMRLGESMEIYQFFAEKSGEEKNILAAFHETVKSIHTLICFNGLTFDIPFLKHREEQLKLSFSWADFRILDIYREVSPFLSLLHLPDKKQKTLETFLGIKREDAYTGGELISIYHQYEKQPTSQAKSLFLLHNYEDILGMIGLLPLLSYSCFFREEPEVELSHLEETMPFGAALPQKELQITLRAPLPFPRQVSVERNVFRIVFRKEHIHLFVPVLEGTLYLYYDNYKDYYYLPLEDMAIHKSVAAFVDKAHRQKATKDTCYAKHKGLFLPQLSDWFSPCFYPGKKEKTSYFEYQEGFLKDSHALCLYVGKILSLFI